MLKKSANVKRKVRGDVVVDLQHLGIAGAHSAHISPQAVGHPFQVWGAAHHHHFVAVALHAQLGEGGKKIEQCVMSMHGTEGVAKPEPLFGKGENVCLTVMKISI